MATLGNMITFKKLLKGGDSFLLGLVKPLWVRRELIVIAALYVGFVGTLIVYWFPDAWSDFSGSWTVRLDYVAKKQLDPNYQLRDEDLKRPPLIPGAWGWLLPDRSTLVSKYVKNTIAQKGDIDPVNLQERPDLRVTGNFLLVVFPLDKQSQLCMLLNADSYVFVMGTKEPFTSKVRVHAVVPNSFGETDKASVPCYVLLEVEKKKEYLLAPDQLAGLHLAMTSN